MTFVLSSAAFANGEAIPARYARWGDNISPPLRWEGAPAGTRSFALILDDPNAPFTTFRHWAVYDIPAETSELPEGAGTSGGALRPRFRQAINVYRHDRYDGPQPPPLHGTHHYHFRLLALDVEALPVAPHPTAVEVETAAEPFVIGEAQLIGTFRKMLFGSRARAASPAPLSHAP
jgi:Raf kinase inhibitor-like YbhB/YbcL family protein